MATTGAYRIQMIGAAGARPGTGRHRLGAPGLKYCRHHRTVRARLVRREVTRRRAARVSRARLSARFAMLLTILVITGTVLVSGWYAAAGAAVIAQMVSP
jgi:hypothetical protein